LRVSGMLNKYKLFTPKSCFQIMDSAKMTNNDKYDAQKMRIIQNL